MLRRALLADSTVYCHTSVPEGWHGPTTWKRELKSQMEPSHTFLPLLPLVRVNININKP